MSKYNNALLLQQAVLEFVPAIYCNVLALCIDSSMWTLSHYSYGIYIIQDTCIDCVLC